MRAVVVLAAVPAVRPEFLEDRIVVAYLGRVVELRVQVGVVCGGFKVIIGCFPIAPIRLFISFYFFLQFMFFRGGLTTVDITWLGNIELLVLSDMQFSAPVVYSDVIPTP